MELDNSFLSEIKNILFTARRQAYTLVNRAMIDAYWDIGHRIIEEEQKGAKRAEYGAFLLRQLAQKLKEDIGKGLDERELRRMRQFYFCFPNRGALRPELTWTHYTYLIRIEDPRVRAYYLKEAADQSWGTRQLERNINSLYYELLRSSKHDPDLLNKGIGDTLNPDHFVKDTYIMEFLGLDVPARFSESDLETAILSNLQHVLLELGRGFAFVGRQYCIKTDTRQYYIDLVFYNIFLKCYCLIDLKISALSHQDIGQMDMYVRMWEDLKKVPGDNPTMGIILCTEKDTTLVKYSVLEENKQLFASSYRLVLPTEEEFSDELKKLTQT